jgi:hypothetical protein
LRAYKQPAAASVAAEAVTAVAVTVKYRAVVDRQITEQRRKRVGLAKLCLSLVMIYRSTAAMRRYATVIFWVYIYENIYMNIYMHI